MGKKVLQNLADLSQVKFLAKKETSDNSTGTESTPKPNTSSTKPTQLVTPPVKRKISSINNNKTYAKDKDSTPESDSETYLSKSNKPDITKKPVTTNSVTENGAIDTMYSDAEADKTETDNAHVSDITTNTPTRNNLFYKKWEIAYNRMFFNETVNNKDSIEDSFDGLSNVTVNRSFNDLYQSVSNKYTMFIDGYVLYSYGISSKTKIKYKALTNSFDKLSPKIWYYTLANDNSKIFNFHVTYIMSNPAIISFYKSISIPKDPNRTSGQYASIVLSKSAEILVPRMTVDMLSTIYDVNENTKDISDILLFSSMPGLLSAITALKEFDINVHLGISPYTPTSTALIKEVSSVFPISSFLEFTGATF